MLNLDSSRSADYYFGAHLPVFGILATGKDESCLQDCFSSKLYYLCL